MTVNGGHATGLFFIYGWRGTKGQFYVAGANTVEQSVDRAREALRRWKRTVAKDVRTGEIVWDSGSELPAPFDSFVATLRASAPDDPLAPRTSRQFGEK